jgi:hypothetical protein
MTTVPAALSSTQPKKGACAGGVCPQLGDGDGQPGGAEVAQHPLDGGVKLGGPAGDGVGLDGAEQVVQVVDEADAGGAPYGDELAHELGEDPTCGVQAEGEAGEHVVLVAPAEAQKVDRVGVHVHMVVRALQVDGEHVVTRLDDFSCSADGLVGELGAGGVDEIVQVGQV